MVWGQASETHYHLTQGSVGVTFQLLGQSTMTQEIYRRKGVFGLMVPQ